MATDIALPMTPVLVRDFAVLLASLGVSETLPDGWLEGMASLKRLENAIDIAKAGLIPHANEVFKTGVLESGATLKNYKKSGKWKFSALTEQRQHELKVLMDLEKANGTAKNTPAPCDPTKDRLFSVSAPVTFSEADREELLDASQTLLQPIPDATASLT